MSDAAELEREAEAARARLSETADELRARMSPGQMMDEVLNQLRGGDGSQMLANLRGQARDNPMALALIGSGLAWLMMGSGPQPQEETAPRPYDPPRPGPDARPWGVATESAPGSRSESGSGFVEGASDAIGSAKEAVGHGLHAAGDQASHLADGLKRAGSDALGTARQSAADLGQQTRRGFLDVLEREPLVIGAIGVAVGAAIGALLPATAAERQHLGAAGEAMKDQAAALVDRGVTMAKETAGEVYASARDEADRQGLLPGDTPIAEKIDAVVRAAGETAGEAAHRQVSERDEVNPV